MPHARFKKNRALSLMETLVSIAVLSILTAIVVAALNGAAGRAKNAKSLNNLKQLGMYMLIYAGEHSGTLPPAYVDGGGPNWFTEIRPYLDRQEIGNPNTVLLSPNGYYPSGTANMFSHYTVHSFVFGVNERPSRRLSTITRPSQLIMMADGAQFPPGWSSGYSFVEPDEAVKGNTIPGSFRYVSDLDAPIRTGPDEDSVQGRGWFRYRNSGRVNVVFFSGAAKSFRKGEVLYRNLVVE